MLEVTELRSGYGDLEVLHGVSLRVQAGTITTVIGANGAGKSTLINTISGLIRPRSGTIAFRNEAIQSWEPSKVVQAGIVQVPEGRRIFAGMSVSENLLVAATTTRSRGRRAENMARVYELFPKLQSLAHQRSGSLSGGEQQMLAIGRGMMADPALLIVDELSIGLAPKLVEEILGRIQQSNDAGLTVMLVDQNVAACLAISHYSYVMENGRIVLEGPAAEVARNDSVRQAYMGI